MRSLSNIFWLGTKELRSFFSDFVLLGFVIYSFSLTVISQAHSNSQELYHASIAIVDEDHSELSRRITHAFLLPYFKPPVLISQAEIEPLMNNGSYTFVIDIPPNFEQDILTGRQAGLQVNVDATAMVQAGLGSGYAQQIIDTEISSFLSKAEGTPLSPVNLAVRVAFNPNVTTSWFASVMGIINNVTMLAIILAGAALVREREHGTHGASPGDAAQPVRDRHVEDLGERVCHCGRNRPVALCRGPRAAWHSDQWIDPALPVRHCAVPVLRNLDRPLPRNGRALNAATRADLYAGRLADEPAVGERDSAGEHAALSCHCDAGLSVHAFRLVCAIDPLSRRRNGRGLAAVPRGSRHRRAFPGAVAAALPSRSDIEFELRWESKMSNAIRVAVLSVLVGLASVNPLAAANPEQGKRLALLYCAKCHATDKVSPSPLRIAPPFRTLHERYPVGMLQESLAEGIVTGHPTMPEFRFDADQVADFIAFLKTLE